MRRYWAWTLAIVMTFLLGASGTYLFRKQQTPDVTYITQKVKRDDINITILATGTVLPENRLEIKPPIAGRIEKIMVKEGEKVRKGQILALMSSVERAAMLDSARAEGIEEVKRWEANYKPTPIVAPILGTIIRRAVEPGQSFTTSDAILVMSDRLTVKTNVDETDIAQVQVGQKATIQLDSYPNEQLDAKVDQVAFEAKTVSNVTTYVVDVLPTETPHFMRSGMTANVTFHIKSKEATLVVPADAVRNQPGKSTVLIPSESGEPVEKTVRVGLSNGKRTEILEGLSEGETILVTQVKPKERSRNSSPLNPMGGGRGGRGR